MLERIALDRRLGLGSKVRYWRRAISIDMPDEIVIRNDYYTINQLHYMN